MVIHLSVLKVRLERYRKLLGAVCALVADYGDFPLSMDDDLEVLGGEVKFVDGLLGEGFVSLEVTEKKR